MNFRQLVDLKFEISQFWSDEAENLYRGVISGVDYEFQLKSMIEYNFDTEIVIFLCFLAIFSKITSQ